jgi:hypothetical protein
MNKKTNKQKKHLKTSKKSKNVKHTHKNKYMQKNKKTGGNVNINPSQPPYNLENILEKQECPAMVKNDITLPSMEFLLEPAMSKSGTINLKNNVDIVLVGWWNSTGSKVFAGLGAIIGMILLFGLGKYMMDKHNKSKLLTEGKEEVKEMLIKHNEELNKTINQDDNSEEEEEEAGETKEAGDKKKSDAYFSENKTVEYIGVGTTAIISLMCTTLFALVVGSTAITNLKGTLQIIHGIMAEMTTLDADGKVIYKGFGGVVAGLIGTAVITGISNKASELLTPSIDNISEHIKNRTSSYGDKIVETGESFTKNMMSDKSNTELLQEEQYETFEKKIKELKIKGVPQKELNNIRREFINNMNKIREESEDRKNKRKRERKNNQHGGFLNYSFFTPYNGNVESSDVIRTVWQDKDLFYTNGKDTGWFHTNTKNLKANLPYSSYVQRIRNINSISVSHRGIKLVNCKLSEDDTCLIDGYGHKLSNVELDINNGELVVPIKITNCGIFLRKDTYSNKTNDSLQYPYPNFINKLPLVYKKITTLVVCKSTKKVDNKHYSSEPRHRTKNEFDNELNGYAEKITNLL